MSKAPRHLPTVMPTDNRPLNAGGAMDDDTSRLDAVAKVTGRAKYSRDRYLPNGLFVGFIRCPWGAASLDSIDTRAAKAVVGVHEVTMTRDEGKYHGHNVGYVVAETKHALRRAIRAAAPQWERRAVRTTITDDAGDPPDPGAKTEDLLAGADHVLEATYSTPVQTHSALETHGVIVDHDGDRATVYATTQGTFSVRDGIGDALNLPTSRYEVVCEYVGGGFGAKFGPGKEGIVAAEVAAKYKRPVYLFVDRAEEHLDTGNRPSLRAQARVGFTADGRPVGGAIHTWGGVGVARGGGGARFPSGHYDLGDVEKTHEDVRFNGGAPRAMRAPGWPQGIFAEELMLDEIATAAGADPLELRTRLDVSENRREMYRRGAELIGWDRRPATGAQSGRLRRGFGVGSTSWPRIPARAEAEVAIHRDGSIEARSGTQDIGQGLRTVVGVVVAEKLGVPLRMVEPRIGRSSLPPGPASGGSMTSPNTAPVLMAAALDAKARLLSIVAERLAVDASELDIADGRILRDGATAMEWADACRRLPAEGIVGRADANDGRAHFGEGHSHGVQFVDLDVDAETGLVHVRRVVAFQACGRVVCRKTAESQIIGGVIQGLSFALFEDKLLDRRTGAMVNPNLEMYKILGSVDVPRIEPILWTKGQTGVRSLGEPPVVPTAGAVACAVYNAIGTPVRHLPLTPDKVLAALEGGAA
ncbi:MAG: xanthine dehydrogenase family protein molybdopterin-binding subunit [Planctomycetes bacterium]|nr:xanthine dehydrogenase family protein molybdopterin-binding subunit [Planctomycetota bacterium]